MNFQTKVDIIECFEKFGAIKSIRRLRNCAFVEFESLDAANVVLTTLVHVLKRRYVKTEVADQWEHPDRPLDMLPDQDSDLHILNALNNDCLLVVFKELELFDLLNVAETCVRFNQQAKEVFRTKYKHLDFQRFNHHLVCRLLNNFGSLLESMEFGDVNINMFNIIQQECKQLKSLSLRGLKCNWANARRVFEPLEILKLKNCAFKKFTNDSIWQLKDLQLEKCDFDIDVLHRWITRCPILEKLSIKHISGLFDWGDLPVVGEYLPNLHTLEFDQEIESRKFMANGMQSFVNLTILKLNFNRLSIAPLVVDLAANKIPIQEFTIIFGDMTLEGANSLSLLERLEVLKLFQCKLKVDILQLLENADKLSLLALKRNCGFPIDICIDIYNAILDTVHTRPNNNRLVIEIQQDDSANGSQVNVPENILNENRDTLDIRECFTNKKMD